MGSMIPVERPIKRLAYWLVLVLLAFSVACSTIQPGRELPVHKLVVLHTNDTHGHPVKFSYQGIPDVGGLPARATLVKAIRKENKNVLVLDAGDLNTGRPESNFFKAKPDIVGYNYIGYDAMVLGNHEFDNPLSVLREQMESASFPFLSANVKTSHGEYLTQPYTVKEFDGFKVAIFGLTTKETEIIGNPDHTKGLVFEDEIAVATKLVPRLTREADVVIALVHMGIFHSPGAGSRRLASHVGGIDLIVDGHTHTRLDQPVLEQHVGSDHSTLIVQAWPWGLVLGRVDLWIQNKAVIDFRFEAIPINLKKVEKRAGGKKVYHFMGDEIREDEELVGMLQPYVGGVEDALSETIGYARKTFFSKDVRNRENALGNIVADSMLWYTRKLGADFAIQNGGGIRADLREGPIRMKSIHEILPFANCVVVLTVRGRDVQRLFDYIATIQPGRGAFPQISEGLSLTINRLSEKCEDILINGIPFDPDRTYKIVTNSYLAGGGDGYKMFLNSVGRYDTSMSQRDVFIEYIKYLGSNIKPKETGRIRIISRHGVSMPLKLAA